MSKYDRVPHAPKISISPRTHTHRKSLVKIDEASVSCPLGVVECRLQIAVKILVK